MLGLSPCLGISSPVPDLRCDSLFCFNVPVIWHLAGPTALSAPTGEEMRCFPVAKGGADHHHARAQGLDPLPLETNVHSWGPSCPASSLCEGSIVSSSACVSHVIFGNPNPCKPCRALTPWNCYALWQDPPARPPPPGVGVGGEEQVFLT